MLPTYFHESFCQPEQNIKHVCFHHRLEKKPQPRDKRAMTVIAPPTDSYYIPPCASASLINPPW